jgi:hypothetical protein
VALTKSQILEHLRAGGKVFGKPHHGYTAIRDNGCAVACNASSVASLLRSGDVVAVREVIALRENQPDALVRRIRSVSRSCGWAIGAHGSMARDIDLIAVPWTDTAVSCEDLVTAITREIGYTTQGQSITKPRPGGRRSILLFHPEARRLDPPDAKGHWDPMVVDLSMFPPGGAK